MSELESRPSVSAFGKRTERLDMMVSERVNEALITMGALKDKSRTEMANDILERVLFGEFSMLKMLAQRGIPQGDDRSGIAPGVNP